MGFKLLKDGLYLLDEAGLAISRHDAIGSGIIQLLEFDDQVVVLEHAERFPRGMSNLYCLDANLRRVWTADLPSLTDVYVGRAEVDRGLIRVGSWEGWSSTIDPVTGHVLERIFAK